MPSKTQPKANASFILSEANGTLSRETVIIDTGNLAAGTVLGRVTATGKYVQHAPGASNGSEHAVAVLYAATDATAGDAKAVVIIRDAEVADNALTWATGITGPQKNTALARLAENHVIVR